FIARVGLGYKSRWRLFGFTLRKIIELFASPACHDHIRVHPDGRRINKPQRRLLETAYTGRHGLSSTQYDFLVGLYEGSELEGFGLAIEETLTQTAPTPTMHPRW
ncbi:unnamed protein product, partial [Ectocarpus sp. 12 AP-2014]